MITIAITGATGFVGSNLIPSLDPKMNVVCINRNQINNEIEEHDFILHLAGKAHDLKKTIENDEYYKINFELTKKLYDDFLISKAKKFIFISSVKAVADNVVDVLTENQAPDPKTHYGKSKLLAEKYIQAQSLPEGKSYYILRPCMIHGPGNKGNLNLLYKFVSKGIPYPLLAFNNKRSFLSVENLCFVVNELIQRNDIPIGIYNVSDDEPLSTIEVVSFLAIATNHSPRFLSLPKSLVQFLAKSGDIFKLPFNTERLQKLTENFVVSNKKIKDVLKKELPLSAREGIIRTARSFKDV